MPDYTILIVDYEPPAVEAAQSILEEAGYSVSVAKDGMEGIEAFHRIQPALTLIEFMLPKKSGLEMCRALRRSDDGKDAALVIMSSRFRGRYSRADAKHTYKADDFLEKPIRADQLLPLVEKMIGKPSAGEPEPSPEPTTALAADPATKSGDVETEIEDRLDSVLDF